MRAAFSAVSSSCYTILNLSPSSRQMYKTVHILIFVSSILTVSCQSQDLDNRRSRISFLNGATTMLSSLAQDLVTRSATSSQVLSLNLTNLFILLVLKAIIYGAGSFGYGHNSYGRSVDNWPQNKVSDEFNFNELLSEKELLMMLSYLKADSTQDYSCLQRVVCENPQKAQEYLFTGKIFLKGCELFLKSTNNAKYKNALSRIEDAVVHGLKGLSCNEKYHCQISQ